MHTQEPVTTELTLLRPEKRNAVTDTAAQPESGLQVLCLEVERQLNRHYKRLLAFFSEAFSDNADYPLSAEQALMLFCISNGLHDTAQLWHITEPVTQQSVFILASLYAEGYVTSRSPDASCNGTEFASLALTGRGEAVAEGLLELYAYVFQVRGGRDVPDAARLASMHVSLERLQLHSRRCG